MTIELDHILVPSKNKNAAAQQLAMILGVDWGPAKVGPFIAVYVNQNLTLDFDEWEEDFSKCHYCFRVDDSLFEQALGRIRETGIPYRGQPFGPFDSQINTSLGGKIVYWSEPDGHVWELLTKSYARRDVDVTNPNV